MTRHGLAALLLFAVIGCGLSDYEKRMDEQRERLKVFDEETALLYDIIEMPKGKDAYGNEIKVPFDIFLRLPIGFSGKFEGLKATYTADKLSLYRYFGNKADVNVLVAWALRSDPKAQVKQEAAGALVAEDFRAKVRAALLEYISRTYSVSVNPPDFSQLKKESRQVVRDGIKRLLEFDSIEFIDPRQNRFSLYFQEWVDRQVAVIYQVPAQQAGQHQRMIDASIKTLDITPIAASERAKFLSRPRG